MKKSVIYYTDNSIDPKMLNICQKQLRNAFWGDIVSVSLQPIDFGRNIVLAGLTRGYSTYLKQILTALEVATSDYVFFCEHDVLYSQSHFDFTPLSDSLYYYNLNNYRWRFPTDVAITYDGLTSLSMLCCNRELAIRHYQCRIKTMKEMGIDENRPVEPRWARRFGYEPGTKKRRRGGITDEEHKIWHSDVPNIDIRHRGTFSHPKTFRHEYKHLPDTFKEVNTFKIPGWDLKSMFGL